MFKLIYKKFSYLQIFIICLGLLILPNLFYQNLSNRGYELAKVDGIKFLAVLLTITNIVYAIIQIYLYKVNFINLLQKLKHIFFSKHILFFIFLFFVILNNLSQEHTIAIHGNFWRSQGLLIYLAIFIVFITTWIFTNKKNYKFIVISLFLSGIIQSLVSIVKLKNYIYVNNISKIFDGFFINGNFGQTNFVTYTLGISFIITYFELRIKNIDKYFVANYLLSICLILQTLAIYFSGSLWTIICLISFVLIFEISLKINKFNKKIIQSITSLFLIISFLFPFLLYILKLQITGDLRIQIWFSVIELLSKSNIHILFAGIGFDYLGEWLKTNNVLTNFYIDRAHNFTLDMYVSMGLIPTIIFIYFTIRNLVQIEKTDQNKNLIMMLVMFWIIKSVIHEFSIVNLIELTTLLAILNRLNTKKEDYNRTFKNFIT